MSAMIVNREDAYRGLQLRIFRLIWSEFEESGLTLEQLGQRLGISARRAENMMRDIDNKSLDRCSDLLLAISGKELSLDILEPKP